MCFSILCDYCVHTAKNILVNIVVISVDTFEDNPRTLCEYSSGYSFECTRKYFCVNSCACSSKVSLDNFVNAQRIFWEYFVNTLVSGQDTLWFCVPMNMPSWVECEWIRCESHASSGWVWCEFDGAFTLQPSRAHLRTVPTHFIRLHYLPQWCSRYTFADCLWLRSS